MAGADALFAALENSPKANKKLMKAAKNYKDVVNVLIIEEITQQHNRKGFDYGVYSGCINYEQLCHLKYSLIEYVVI
ncbi:hypothetical protein BDD26_1616 [Xenorhabdus cabanillasii]|uniref:Uncharacterized protein n=1 Tax=Xenorhabdus cabanillasii TaxID=351673 RepID=A0A3D9UBM6_9GAMM|nr:DUF1778 domain-containing protein [Xenorhabdus cabanillasii]REF26908.1 hypothetical protein BDD26_1616 [Xenorhabdus cabanillasii]